MYTRDSLLTKYVPMENADNIVLYVANLRGATYKPVAIREILGYYQSFCQTVGLDPYLVFAQCLHETAYLRSEWSQRPRRNPAGIRVTGERKQYLSYLDDPKEWQKLDDGLYYRGLAFASWRQSAYTHIGHLLCYVYKDSEMNTKQLYFATYSPNARKLGELGYRGVAKRLSGLNRRWAVGAYYADAIARLANELRKV
jgi:hypothetical protein